LNDPVPNVFEAQDAFVGFDVWRRGRSGVQVPMKEVQNRAKSFLSMAVIAAKKTAADKAMLAFRDVRAFSIRASMTSGRNMSKND